MYPSLQCRQQGDRLRHPPAHMRGTALQQRGGRAADVEHVDLLAVPRGHLGDKAGDEHCAVCLNRVLAAFVRDRLRRRRRPRRRHMRKVLQKGGTVCGARVKGEGDVWGRRCCKSLTGVVP